MPNCDCLFQLVAYFDNPHQYAQPSSRSSLPNLLTSPLSLASRYTTNRTRKSALCSLPTLPSIQNLSFIACSSAPARRGAPYPSSPAPSSAGDEAPEPPPDSDEDEATPNYSARRDVLLNLPPLRVQINIARHVLLLLPRRHLSVVVCLLIFARLQVCPDSGLAPEDVGRMLGGVLFGGRTRKDDVMWSESEMGDPERSMPADEKGKEQPKERDIVRAVREKDEKGLNIAVWLVKHWENIAAAYEADDEARFGRRGGRIMPLSRNGTQGEVPRARSKSCSVVESTGAWDRCASRTRVFREASGSLKTPARSICAPFWCEPVRSVPVDNALCRQRAGSSSSLLELTGRSSEVRSAKSGELN